jgi:dTDP-4-dehydrorhamnose reductase
MKILLFGKHGQLGWELHRSLAPLGDLLALGTTDTGAWRADFNDLDSVARIVRDAAPDVIVNAAAYTAVDDAEAHPDIAHRVNAGAPEVLAREAQARGALLIHYSTDYVFDGSGDRPWLETDVPAPLNVYGRTKLAGEQAIQRNCERHLIFRTSWVHAARGGNFIRTMLRLAGERDRLTVVSDQIGAPTGAELLADVTAHCLRTLPWGAGDISKQPAYGTYHLTAAGATSWFEFAVHVIEAARRLGVPIKVAREAIVPIPTDAFPRPARRPLNSRLDTQKLRDAFGLRLPSWQAGVDRVVAELAHT